jgi:hypothetical protein
MQAEAGGSTVQTYADLAEQENRRRLRVETTTLYGVQHSPAGPPTTTDIHDLDPSS